MPELSPFSWFLLVLGATGVGISKSGLAGVSLIHVIVFAQVFGAKASTGALLPLLIVGDCCECGLLDERWIGDTWFVFFHQRLWELSSAGVF